MTATSSALEDPPPAQKHFPGPAAVGRQTWLHKQTSPSTYGESHPVITVKSSFLKRRKELASSILGATITIQQHEDNDEAGQTCSWPCISKEITIKKCNYEWKKAISFQVNRGKQTVNHCSLAAVGMTNVYTVCVKPKNSPGIIKGKSCFQPFPPPYSNIMVFCGQPPVALAYRFPLSSGLWQMPDQTAFLIKVQQKSCGETLAV